ncbi:hypothetical protein BGV48_02455 [Burkholderia ubonensis]|nr:hypothetical protein BGV48_02455 [Burkholderia ubonensis]
MERCVARTSLRVTAQHDQIAWLGMLAMYQRLRRRIASARKRSVTEIVCHPVCPLVIDIQNGYT